MPDASICSNPLRKLKSKSPSTRPASLQPLPLAVYLTGAVGSTFLVSAPQAEAAVTSVTFGFGSVLSPSSPFGGPAATDPNLGNIFAYGYSGAIVLGRSFYHQAERGFYGTPTFFAAGTTLGAGGNGAGANAGNYAMFLGSRINLADQLNKNIGFKTSTNNFGWANVSWNAAAKALTFHSAYVESVAGNTITVGDIGAVPEPSRALLALAGLGAAALRRRRKQAA
jgi:hypothetical protein